MTAPLLSVRDLRVEFPGPHGRPLVALDGVSFDLHRGEVLGMVGESGAGKSLTGAAIAGLIAPPGRVAAGERWLQGERLDHLTPAAWRQVRGRRVATIFQDPLTALNPLATVGAQLVETIRAHGSLTPAQARRRAADLLAETGIPGAASRLDDHPHQFSGGMRQRVVIALALAAEPELLVADEPTTALDVSVQAQITGLLRRLCDTRGLGVLLVTHDMGVVADTCDRVAVLYAGRIVELGSVDDVIHRPAHPYTVGLMGAIPPLDAVPDRLLQIGGVMPRLSARPSGCPFHPRCPHAMPRCAAEFPPARDVGGTRVCCWLHHEAVA